MTRNDERGNLREGRGEQRSLDGQSNAVVDVAGPALQDDGVHVDAPCVFAGNNAELLAPRGVIYRMTT